MLKVRRYQPSDFEAVWTLHSLALEASGAFVADEAWSRDLRSIDRVYLEDSGEFLVGIDEEQLVAMGALLRLDASRAELKRMRVHPDVQRRGYGQVILQALEARATELGYTVLEAETTTKQAPALAFYRKHGYREVSQSVVYGFDCIRFAKTLR